MNATLVQQFGPGELWVGGQVPDPRHLAPFDAFVASAVELPYLGWEQYGINILVVRCPMHDDGKLHPDELANAGRCSRVVAHLLQKGKKVLVTCAMGLNRSALIAALTIKRMTFCTPEQAINALRQARGSHALSNPVFVAFLRAGVLR